MWEKSINNEYNDKESTSPGNELPNDLYELDTIDRLDDEIDPYEFHWDKEFLNFIKSSRFDKIYYISVYPYDIQKYSDIESVYNLLERYKKSAWLEKLQLVIFRKWENSYNTKEEVDKLISDYADKYVKDTKEIREKIMNVLKTQDTTSLSDEKTKERLIECFKKEPMYLRFLSNWGKYRYLIWWWRGPKAETWKHYIDVMENNWVNMINIE